jgi:methyl-accepting chemotaxis protein
MKRRYITEGLAKFAGFMRAGDNLKSMGDNFIRNLVRYLDAVQGGLFLLEEGDDRPYLNLLAAFAYDRKKFFEKRIEIGEGLIGTCAIEKNTINITEVPEGYISITSGLGDTPPENLLLIPVIYEGELLGVVEVASLRRFLDHEIKFAEEVAKNLGSTIVYTRNSEITSTLLGKSQQQALEMAEQEEEMRQNMEELKATQEESARREEEYKSLIRALDMSFHIIEYDAETGLVSDVNELTCKLMGSGRDYFTGKTHQQIFNSSLNTDKAFRAKVNHDKIVVETEDVEIKGKKIKLKHRFSPVHNSSGTLVKYVNFATVEDIVIKD